ncbi:MAG TPA: ATP-dependent RecD-like DNA helicase [Erysipelothrix sp.]|nr:ATP-dependent RecD-like DNA helicase [Erysipelothrix sp.]
MDNQIQIEVLIKRKIYSSANFYSVYLVMLNDQTEKTMTAVGYVPQLELDQIYILTGQYKEHYRYGLQFEIQQYEKLLANSTETLIKYLSSSLFPGIGKVKAQRIIDYYGTDLLTQIQEDDDFVFTDPFLSIENQQTLINQLRTEVELEKQINFFAQHGITMRQTLKIEQIYGKDAITKIKENPYRMVDEVEGIGFKTCDKLASSLGFKKDHPERISAILVFETLQDCLNSGSTFTTIEKLLKRLPKYKLDDDKFSIGLQETINSRRLVLDNEALYHKSQYEAEVINANYFNQMPIQKITPLTKDLDQLIQDYQAQQNIIYDESQIKAIKGFFNNDKTIITGGPGTGKTTIIQAIIALFREAYPHYDLAICAPTGRAAKRLKEIVNVNVTTIHSLLEWNLETNKFARNEVNPVLNDILIIDEFSMVDNYVMSALALAMPKVRKILFIGDKDQLPSVGPGFLIRDLINSGVFSVNVLDVNYRQNQESHIIDIASAINQGRFDQSKILGDVVHINQRNYIKESVIEVTRLALEKGYTIDDVQVLACKYDGSDGIDQLNLLLQRNFNPQDEHKREFRFGYMTFREGDKLLQLKNQPDDFVFNGDIGTLVEIVFKAESDDNKDRLIVDFDGNIVEYDTEIMIHLKHAYCTSVHKAQGSEYPIVIFVGSPQHRFMMNKRLFYTAVSRARNGLILIGPELVFSDAAKYDHSPQIKTKLVERINGM